MHRFVHFEVVFGMKWKLLLASLYVFITQCNKLYFQYSCFLNVCVAFSILSEWHLIFFWKKIYTISSVSPFQLYNFF